MFFGVPFTHLEDVHQKEFSCNVAVILIDEFSELVLSFIFDFVDDGLLYVQRALNFATSEIGELLVVASLPGQ